MNYTLHQLQIFLKIVELQSVSKAADALFLSQPAVSMQLKNLQDQFDIPLTEIIGRKIFITDFGMEIAQASERILEEVYNINHKTLAYKGQLTGRLKIAVVSTGKYVMPYFLSEFLQKNPGIELKMDVTNRQRVIQSLAENEADFALVSILPDQLAVEKLVLMPQLIYMAGAANNSAPFDWDESILILREEGSGTRILMEKFLARYHIKYRRKMELTSNEAVKQAVVAGLGFSCIPLVSMKHELRQGELKIIPAELFPIETEWQLIWLKGKKLMPASQAWIEFLKQNRALIVRNSFGWLNDY